ncbi:MAG: hypothetical protein N3B21_04770 [Clostridia bacterium]|nr:hypothetical protein [Clostridia bacterium]
MKFLKGFLNAGVENLVQVKSEYANISPNSMLKMVTPATVDMDTPVTPITL